MDTSWMTRTQLLVGEQGLEKLLHSEVLVVGMGGVGSYAAEALVRAGIGNLTIVDGDVVDPSNRNRQIPALATTHGLRKVDVMEERLCAINPDIHLTKIPDFLTEEKIKELLLSKKWNYVVDAIDSITPKLTILSTCYYNKIPIIASMGAGGKMDPTQVQVKELFKTYNCNLAHYIRKRLRKYGIKKGIKAVFSPELSKMDSLMLTDGTNFKKSAFGTISYLPAVFGLTCASVVIRDLVQWKPQK